MVHNGYLPERQVQMGIDPATVKVPKMRANTGEPVTFRSALMPPYVRKTRILDAALPWLYLKGVSSGEIGAALKVLVGPQANGLSASTVSRLKQVWARVLGHGTIRSRPLGLCVDGWCLQWVACRAEQTKLCALVAIGVNEHGQLPRPTSHQASRYGLTDCNST